MSVEDSTFVGGKHLPGHRWYKLRPSFSPTLVLRLREAIGPEHGRLLDPFSGAGTTVLTAKALGLPSHGIELNPFLAAYSAFAADWSAPAERVTDAERRLGATLRQRFAEHRGLALEDVEADLGIERPHIHNVLRWWRADVLATQLVLKRVLGDATPGTIEHRLLWLTLATSCIELANVKRLHPNLSFYDRACEAIDAEAVILAKLAVIAGDLADLGGGAGVPASIACADSLERDAYPDLGEPVALITSPPYANRYSYVWETRPHLYMMDLIGPSEESGALDLRSPGGTWGKATTILRKGRIEPEQPATRQVLGPAIAELRASGAELMANYVVRYFNMMGEHLRVVAEALPSGSVFSYVVGNSRIKGVDIDTQGCLAAQMAEAGLRPHEVVVFRKRIGRQDLFELSINGTRP